MDVVCGTWFWLLTVFFLDIFCARASARACVMNCSMYPLTTRFQRGKLLSIKRSFYRCCLMAVQGHQLAKILKLVGFWSALLDAFVTTRPHHPPSIQKTMTTVRRFTFMLLLLMLHSEYIKLAAILTLSHHSAYVTWKLNKKLPAMASLYFLVHL